MSTHRLSPARGWVNPDRLPKGPNGRALCRECGTEVPAGRKTFCSSKCVDQWKIRSDPTFVRIKLFERDHGICALCARDCVAVVKELERLDTDYRGRWDRSCYGKMKYGEAVAQNGRLKRKLAELKISVYRYLSRHRYGIWDADHIVPVIEGGGESSLENYRTLCCQCHKEETAKLRKRRAKKRSPGSS